MNQRRAAAGWRVSSRPRQQESLPFSQLTRQVSLLNLNSASYKWNGVIFHVLGGLVFCALSVFVQHVVLSAVLAVIGFAMLWSIGELKEQTERVKKGWFPANPNRAKK